MKCANVVLLNSCPNRYFNSFEYVSNIGFSFVKVDVSVTRQCFVGKSIHTKVIKSTKQFGQKDSNIFDSYYDRLTPCLYMLLALLHFKDGRVFTQNAQTVCSVVSLSLSYQRCTCPYLTGYGVPPPADGQGMGSRVDS